MITKQGILLQAPQLSNQNSLKTLVENRTVYTLNHCELNIFETYQQAQLVPLKFNDLVVTSMLRGKKVMHLFDQKGFDYLPGETVIVPPNIEMKIDFPEASYKKPTQCLALALDYSKINETLNFLNEKYPKEGTNNYWELHSNNYFFYNNADLAASIQKLIKVSLSSSVTKDIIADLTLQEMLIQIIQLQTLKATQNDTIEDSKSTIMPIVSYIRENLNNDLSLKKLTDFSCMSKTTFHRFFKKELGMSPVEFIMHEKIKMAKALLNEPNIQINQVSYELGFDDSNYFIRLFKKHEGITPKQYQKLTT
ncbi:AraC family transcriptional regulator [Flavobacterium kingsejongi]|uniref:AraC family transcriptional regulator n=1 Tax=Flavobacterium kingsejongi TaxID=1678728 RepID=A0A2S1LTE2_9FLAO|nr:AraC family transcriptional regulator [Flavobacterium kingsejongi]AWG27023.1 AraC family transcriptional regulator [Flavobacterium kingsejongi]